jgi:hypothetical protein
MYVSSCCEIGCVAQLVSECGRPGIPELPDTQQGVLRAVLSRNRYRQWLRDGAPIAIS